VFLHPGRSLTVLARSFPQASLASKAYLVFQLLGPPGIALAVLGAINHDHGLLIVGAVIGGLYFLDLTIVWPSPPPAGSSGGGARKHESISPRRPGILASCPQILRHLTTCRPSL
jgi:hypothetical protein